MEYFECQKYLNSKIEFYEYFLRFIEDESNEITNFQYVVDIIDSHNYQNNTDELKSMLCMIREISGNHHRTPSFFKKFEMFFSHYAECIKNTFTAIELFNIFRKNRRILLILVDIKIIPDKEITELLQKQNFSNLIRYQFDGDLKPNIRLKHNQIGTKETLKQNYKYYFYPEMLPYISKWNKTRYENDLLRIDKNIFDKLDKIRRIGENDSYICQLIRQDSVEEFDTYACKTLLNLGSLITPSIFETNTLLIKKKPSLIEYAAFFGSVKIFNYLRMNEVELKPSLWIYAIHSNKPEIIHILENLEIEPEDESYIECLKESIKCHHNDIARYIRDNLMDQEIKNEIFYFNKNQFSFGFHYHNYSFLEDSQLMQFSLFYACKYDYFPLVKLLINMDEFDVKQSIILNFFLSQSNNINIVNFLLKQPEIQICDCCFFECPIITEICIPSSVTSIGKYAFYYCSSLKKITFKAPSSLFSIESNAFECCYGLKEITIPSSVISLGGYSFNNCSLKQIFFEKPSSLQLIGSSAFSGCRSLEQISFPPSLVSIEREAFKECRSLKQILFEEPSSLNIIGKNSFYECKSLMEVSIPTSVTKIEDSAFTLCESLKKLVILSPETFVEKGVFKGCPSISEVSIPSTLNPSEIGIGVEYHIIKIGM